MRGVHYLDIEASFCACLYEHDIEFSRFGVALLNRHLPAHEGGALWLLRVRAAAAHVLHDILSDAAVRSLMSVAALSPISGPAACQVIPFVNQICLIANQDDNDVTSPLCSHLLNPTRSVEEGLPICADRSSDSVHHQVSLGQIESPACTKLSRSTINTADVGRAGELTRYIIDNYCHRRVADVAGYQAAKSVLAGCVPAASRHFSL